MITVFSSCPKEIKPFTLEFYNKEIKEAFFNFTFSYQYLFIFSIVEIALYAIPSILTIIVYVHKKNSLNNLFLFTNYLALVFIILTIVFIILGRKSEQHKRVLSNFVSSTQITCYKIIFMLLLSIIKENYNEAYETTEGFIWISEVFVSCFYAMFIASNFIIHLVCHSFCCLFIFIIETFLHEKIQFSFIFLCSLLVSVFTCGMSYLQSKKQRMLWLYFHYKTKEKDYYSEVLSYDSLISATFKDNKLINYNKNLWRLIEMTNYRSVLEKMKQDNKDFDYNSEINSQASEEFSLIVKKLLFSQIKIKNDNLHFLIKEQLLLLQSDEIHFSDRIKGLFSIIMTEKESFRKIHYLGAINFDNSEQQYSAFIQVNKKKDTISYIALGLDFPIVISQNIEILSKIALLNSKITHEIKNPLAAVQTLIKEIKTFIENTGINEVVKKLDTIDRYSEYIKFITKDFEVLAMKLNNISQQKNLVDINIERVKFREMIDFAVDLIKHIWKNKNSKVLIKYNIDHGISEFINTDEIRVKQIIINLLSNSLKFTRMGSVTLTCENIDADYISIIVQDTGVGMKEDKVKALNQNDCLFLKSNENNKMGSGLGLSIVRDMIKALGKDFTIQSKYDTGTRMSFLLNKHNNFVFPTTNPPNNTQTNQSNNNMINRIDSIKHQPKISSKKLDMNTFNNFNNNNNISTSNIPLFQDEKSLGLLEEKTKREEYVLLKPNELNGCVKEKITNDSIIDIKQLNNINSCFAPKRGVKQKRSRLSFPKMKNNPIKDISNNGEFSDSERVNKKKIYALVVDDEQLLSTSNVNSITKYFNNKGVDISVDNINDGIECLYKIYKGFSKEIKYRFIVTDENMTVMDGSLMTQTIRTLIDKHIFYPIKIYSSSGIITDDNFKKNYEGTFTKPLKIEEVAKIYLDNVENFQKEI